jgi:hypothetical protein
MHGVCVGAPSIARSIKLSTMSRCDDKIAGMLDKGDADACYSISWQLGIFNGTMHIGQLKVLARVRLPRSTDIF